LVMTVSVCHTRAFGQVIPVSDDRESAFMARRTPAPSEAIHPGFQNALRLALLDRNWIRGRAFQPCLLSLAPIGRRTVFQPAALGGPLRFGLGSSLPRAESHHQSVRFFATAADPLVTDNWLGGTGTWNVASNWSGGVPNNGTPVGTTYDIFI